MLGKSKKENFWFIFEFLEEQKQELTKEQEKQVMIERAINLRLMCDYIVTCSYGDIVLIIAMLHDYVNTLDEIMSDNIHYQVYYRKKFLEIANGLSEQIEYDYDKAVEKCRKKILKQDSNSDVGEEALTLAVRANQKR